MNKIFQEHTVRLTINIKQLTLKVTLPAKITFAVLLQGKTLSQSTKAYKAEDQVFRPFEKHIIDFNIGFDTKLGSYHSKEILLAIKFQTNSNEFTKIVKFEPIIKGSTQKSWVLPLQNNTDFKIHFSTSYSLLQRKPKHRQNKINDPYNLLKKQSGSNENNSVITQLAKLESGNSKKGSQLNGDKTKRLENVKSIPLQSKKYIPNSRIFSPRFTESNQTTKMNQQIDKLKKKIEKEREEKVRSISKLKVQVNPNFLQKLQRKDKDEQSQISKLRDKIRNLQRKERNLTLSIQQLNSEIGKYKNKINQLQKNKEESQRHSIEKENKIKSMQATIRTLSEQLETLTSKQRCVSKKGEVKQNIFKDQIRRLQEKLKQSQALVTQLDSQKNQMIKNIQQIERSHSLLLKERETKTLQQKQKNQKIHQQYIYKQKSLLMQIQTITQQKQSLEIITNEFSKKMNSFEQATRNYQKQMTELKQAFRLQKFSKEQFDADSQQKDRSQFNKIKIKCSELTLQNNKLIDKLNRCETARQISQARVKELEELLKAKTVQGYKHNSKISSFMQNMDSVNEEIQRKNKQIQHLKQTNVTIKAKWVQAKQKAQQERLRHQQASRLLQKHLNEFEKQKQLSEEQIKQLRWVIIQKNDNINELQYEIKQLNNNTLKMNQEIMAKKHRIATLQENLHSLTTEKDRLLAENENSTKKFRQISEKYKSTNFALQQLGKLKQRLQRQVQQQRQRGSKYQASFKERQLQQAQKYQQKQLLLNKKQAQMQILQLQYKKLKQDIVVMKNTNELTIRQAQLAKMDYDSAKSQLNLIQSSIKALKQQNLNLITQQQTLINTIKSYEQNHTAQIKKKQDAIRQMSQFKDTVERALQNLLNQLFKEDYNLNIISSSLLPFPSQQLSALQIKLIQRRNTFIIKHRQRTSDLQSKVDTLEHQLKSLKEIYLHGEEQMKKEWGDERSKLKGLLYENMLQKNQLNQELILQRKEKEQMQKYTEKLKAELFSKNDLEQELNHQLQILLLQQEALKSDCQSLNELIARYKQQDAQAKASYDQQMATAQEEWAIQIGKLNNEKMNQQGKIIQLEKQILQSTEKIQQLQKQKAKTTELLELSRQSNKIADQKIINNQVQNTKLNNLVKHLQKKEANYRDSLFKMESEFTQYIQKYQILQTAFNSLNNDLFESNLQRQKTVGELLNAKEKCSELEKMVHQKGQAIKQRLEKKMQENSQLKSTIIKLTSEVQLKQFYLHQQQQNYKALTQESQELKRNNINLKARVKQLVLQVDQSDSKVKELSKEVQKLVKQVYIKQEKFSQTQFTMLSLQNDLQEIEKLRDSLKEKQKQCIEVRLAKSHIQQYYANQLKKQKQTINELKQLLKSQQSNLNSIDREYKANIQSISKDNRQRYKFLQSQFLKEKDDFEKKVQQIQAHNKRVIAQYEYRIEIMKDNLEQAKYNQNTLMDQIGKKDQQIRSLGKKIERIERDLDEQRQRYNKYYHLYQQIKEQLNQNNHKMTQKHQQASLRTKSQLRQIQNQIQRMNIEMQPNRESPSNNRLIKQIFEAMSSVYQQLQGRNF